MRRRRLLLALVLCAALVTSAFAFTSHRPGHRAATARPEPAAGPAAPEPVSFDTTRVPIPLSRATSRWDQAVRDVVLDGSALYSWKAWIGGEDDPIEEESGGYGIFPLRTEYERTVRVPGTDRSTTARIRRRAGQMYLQIKDWGPWEGCWLHTTPGELGRLSGLDLAGSPEIPVSVGALLDATVTDGRSEKWFGSPYDEYSAEVNAAEAIPFLGLPLNVVQQYQHELLDVQVPIIVALGVNDRPYGAAMLGDQVAHAIEKAGLGISPDLLAGLSQLRAMVRIEDPGTRVTVTPPADRELIPLGTTRSETCSAAAPKV